MSDKSETFLTVALIVGWTVIILATATIFILYPMPVALEGIWMIPM